MYEQALAQRPRRYVFVINLIVIVMFIPLYCNVYSIVLKKIIPIVRVLSGVKRSSSNHGHSKSSSSKRSYLSESQSSITHTGSPVNPMTAKALASKLNERNNMLNGAKKVSGHGTDIPIPPLISIQTSSSSVRFKDGNDSQHRDSTLHRSKFSQAKKVATTDSHSKSLVKTQKIETFNKQLNGSNPSNHSKLVNNLNVQ